MNAMKDSWEKDLFWLFNREDDKVLAVDMANTEENEGLPCPFCGCSLKRLQLDRTETGVKVRINWHWTREEALKQMRGLLRLIKGFFE